MTRKKSKGDNINIGTKTNHNNKPSHTAAATQEGGDEEEDLSLQRHRRRIDEETVLSAIYGDDFIAEAGAWNCPLYKIRIHHHHHHHDDDDDEASRGKDGCAPPPHTTTTNKHYSCELTLSIQLNKKYPHSIPLIHLANTTTTAATTAGDLHEKPTTNNYFQITTTQISELLNLLQRKATECLGEVMCWELGQVVEAYLVDCIESRRRRSKNTNTYCYDDGNNRSSRISRIKNVKFHDEDRASKEEDYDDDDWLNFGDDEEAASSTDIITARTTEFDTMVDSDTQREVARQIEAMENAARIRKERRQRRVLPSIADDNNNNDGGDDVDDVVIDGNSDQQEYDYPELTAAITSPAEQQLGGGGNYYSRYQTDFVEIAHLGRGGGGEVVQAINRLDRRVYAIKKVLLLEEETGATATTSWTTLQNEKLRREVTTISMMSHKNIVRYYQAWVEYPMVIEKEKEESHLDSHRARGRDSGGVKKILLDENKLGGNKDENEENEYSSWDSSSSSSASSSSPSSASLSSSSSSSSSSDSCNSPSKLAGMNADKSLSQLSLDNFLEHEVGFADFANPLLGNGTLLGYNPLLTSSSLKQPSSSRDRQLQSQSYSTSDQMHAKNSGIMYIQMQYCKTTMRDMIDKSNLTIETVWKSLRQILEALVYIHGRNVIHRDLKPANIFIDDEENIRLGDFGLATSNRPSAKPHDSVPESEAIALHEAIDDISGLLGAASTSSANRTHNAISMASITGGVGTALYMAPEQEFSKSLKGKPSYDSKADIFSLGVLLFEMFMLKPIGCTYMERAEILTTLRGEPRRAVVRGMHTEDLGSLFTETGDVIGDLKHHIEMRFPADSNIPFNAQKIILWCLERSPTCRPSAEQLLTCDLLPRKVELEEKYLNEVMRTLSKSDQSFQQILAKLFHRSNPNAVLTTFDNEISIRANNIDAHQLLAKALDSVKGSSIAARNLLYSRPMSGVALAGVISALRRAHNAGTVSGGGKEGEALRGAPYHAAMIIAMNAASSAAVEGCAYGALGADPRVVEGLCRKLCGIFYSHGAVRLQGPLLRPTDPNDVDTSLNKPVDLLARRGSVLRLREDLCIPFARALSRGGSSTTNLKRFDINKVFSESDAGLHPKESLEASFDIIQDENTAISEFLEAETILVLCQAMSLLASRLNDSSSAVLKSPTWELKLTHTRLSDAIMDLMFVPTSEAIRNCCLNIFTTIMTCPPQELCNQGRKPANQKTCEMKTQKQEFLDKCIETAVIVEKLPKKSGKRLRAFLSHLLIPQLDANNVLDIVYESIREMHNADMNSSNHSTEVKNLSKNCYSEATRCINQLRHLIKAMEALGIVATSNMESLLGGIQKNMSYPTFISIDLGLRHRRNHYSGRLYFQAVLLHNDFFRTNGENNLYTTFDGMGTRIAEGGRYDDLVRQIRPPGKFGSVNEFTVAKVPFCSGLLIFVGKMVERIYHNAADNKKRQNQSFIENLRSSLGHPLPVPPINCIVTSENGLDLASCSQRAKICALLWSSGISCEYLAQSGVMMSLLQHLSSDARTNNEWSSSVDRICGICAILNIPYVIIVQPHLLKTKSVVKLRRTTTHTASGISFNIGEELVPLLSLPTVLLERLGSQIDMRDHNHLADPLVSNGDNLLVAQSPNKIEFECIYVGTDQYFDSEQKANNTQWKHVRKVMKATTQRMATRLNDLFSQSLPVIAMDLPFQAVRDIGSSLLFDGLESLTCNTLQSKYPEHKKVLRNLAYALDALIQKVHSRPTSSEEKNRLTLFLYSVSCDKFDMITLTLP